MKLSIKINLDKEKEDELAYTSILDMFYASYKMLQLMNSEVDLPELSCESCDCGDSIEYRFETNQNISLKDLQQFYDKNLNNIKLT